MPLTVQPVSMNGREPVDPVVAGLVEQPFRLMTPAEPSSPCLFASPHSGSLYPPSLLALSRLDALSLRRSEDAFVDELFAGVPALGAYFLAARFPRAYVDVNRTEKELDPAMFDAPPPGATKSARVAAGFGVIPRVVRDGLEIYRQRLPLGEADFRLNAFYRPYHARLAGLVAETKARFGAAIVIDCHSMPPPAKGHDIVLGDCHGEAASPKLVARFAALLEGLGFAVARNAPYAGGYTTHHYGQPQTGVHAVQIEISRALYLDDKRMEKTPGFEECRTRLTLFLTELLAPGALSAVL